MYEDLAVDPEGTASAVLELAGLDPADIPAAPLRRQSDDRSERWIERYRGEVTA